MHAGFEIDYLESADVHNNLAGNHMDWTPLVPLIRHRERDLGQYLFARAVNGPPASTKRPEFLFRSYPANEIERVPAAVS